MRLLKALPIRRFLVCVPAILAATGPAQAVTLLATGMGENDGSGSRCYAANVGTKPVRVNSMKIVTFDGVEVSLDSGNCTFPGNISPGLACVIQGNGGSLVIGPIRCVIEVATSSGAKSIRGSFIVHPTQILDAR